KALAVRRRARVHPRQRGSYGSAFGVNQHQGWALAADTDGLQLPRVEVASGLAQRRGSRRPPRFWIGLALVACGVCGQVSASRKAEQSPILGEHAYFDRRRAEIDTQECHRHRVLAAYGPLTSR